MMTSYKPSKMCSQDVLKNNKIHKCHNKTSCIIQSKNVCWTHLCKNYTKPVIYIQKIYRAFYIRKKLKNIYYRLPPDLQEKICSYINQSVQYKRYKKLIKTFILLRYNSFIDLTHPILYVDLTIDPEHVITNHFEILNSVLTCYKLHIKYFNIIEYRQHEKLYLRCRNYYLSILYFNNLNDTNPEFDRLVSECRTLFIDYIRIFNK